MLTVIYFGLRSSLVEKQLIPYLKPIIKEQSGFDLEVEKFRFDLFGDLKLEQLSLNKLDLQQNQNIDLTLDSLELHYDLSKLLQGCVSVEALTVRGLKVNGHLPLGEGSKNEVQQKGVDSEFSTQQLLKLLNEPPVAIEVKQLKIEPVVLDLQLFNSQQEINYKGVFSSEGSLKWCKSNLHGMIGFAISDTVLELEQQGTNKTKLLTHPLLKSQLEWEVKPDNKNLIVEIKPATLAFNTGTTTLYFSETQKEIQLALQDYKLRVQLEGDADILQPLESNFAWQLEQKLLTSDLSAEISGTKIQLDPADFSLALQGLIADDTDGVVGTLLQNHVEVNLETDRLSLVKNQNSENKLSLAMSPSYSLHSNAQISLTSENGSNKLYLPLSQVETTQNLTINKFEMLEGKNRTTFDKQTWKLDASLKDQEIMLQSDLDLRKLETPFLLKHLSSKHQLSYSSDTKFKQAMVKTSFEMDGLTTPLLDFSLGIDNRAKNLTLSPSIALNIPQSLQQWSKQLEVLNKTGDLKVDIKGKTDITHFSDDVLDVNWTQFDKMPFETNWNLTLQQLSQPTDGLLQIKGPVNLQLDLARTKTKQYKSNLALNSNGVFYPPLEKPLPIDLNLDAEFDESLSKIDSNSKVKINYQPFINYKLQISNKPKNMDLQSKWNFYADSGWKQFLPQLEVLEKTGNLHIQNDLNLHFSHPFNTMVKFDPSALNRSKTEVHLNGSLEQYGKNENVLVSLIKPLRYQHTLHWQEDAMSLEASYGLENISVKNKFDLENVQLNLSAKPNHGLKPNAFQAEVKGSGEKVELFVDENSSIQLSSLLFPLFLRVDADLNESVKHANLNELQLSLGGGWLQQNLNGFASVDGKDAIVKGLTSLQLRDQLFKVPLPPLSGSGNVTMPWQITLADAKQVSLQSEIVFNELSIATEKLLVSDMRGKIRIDEELQLHPDGNISFGYILPPEPFQRVDFGSIEPYLNNQESLSIKSLQFGDMVVGPMQAKIPIKQNMIQLQQFNLKLFGGHIAGQLYLNTAPNGWSFGILSRITQVDLRELLADKEDFEASPISARTALEFDFSKRLLQGRIDITEITQSQLLQLLEVLDPNHEDAQLNQARNALGFAHPESVAINMDRGLVDLSIALSLLPEPIEVRGVPLTPLIERFAGEVLDRLGQLPLK